MTYKRARSILGAIRQKHYRGSRIKKLFDAKCRESGRSGTFIVMRFGDPRKWKEMPKGKVKSIMRGKMRFHSRKTYMSLHRRERLCVLENIDTGKIVTTHSISDFCRESGLAKLNPNARYHITPILDGDRPSYKGWFLPETLKKVIKLRDLYDNVYEMTVKEWIQKHGTAGSALKLLTGTKKFISNNRLTLASSPIDRFLQPRTHKITGVTLVKGNRIVRGKSMCEVAEKLGVAPVTVYEAGYGFRDNVEGFKIDGIEQERKKVLSV